MQVTAITLNKSERRKNEFREKIIDAALHLFERNGVANTSVASIIKEADIAHKTFFNHFPSKVDLLQTIVMMFSGHAYSVFEETFKRFADPRKRIDYCFTEIAKSLEHLNPNFKELVNFYLISGVGDSVLHQSEKQQFGQFVNRLIVDAKTSGHLRPGFSQTTLTDMVAGICVSTLLYWCVEEDYPLRIKMNNSIKFINASIFVDTY